MSYSIPLSAISLNSSGQLVFGASIASGAVSSITGTTNQVIASASSGAITLSLPQSINTTSNPTFNSLLVSGDANFGTGFVINDTASRPQVAMVIQGSTSTLIEFIPLGASHGIILSVSATTQSANRTYTLPDVGANANVVLDHGAYTIAGALTLSSVLTSSIGSNKLFLDGTGTTNQIGNNYDLGTIPNATNSTAAINFNCPASAASVTIGASSTVNSGPTVLATFAGTGLALTIPITITDTTDSTLINQTIGSTAAKMYSMIAGTNTGSSNLGILNMAKATGVNSTTFTTIAALTSANFILILGFDGTNGFGDTVLCGVNGGMSVIAGISAAGSPATRTYQVSGGNLQLKMGSGSGMSCYSTGLASVQG